MIAKVSCHIITYNQKDYISQCINGILMQQTDFPFEIIIGDDNSTDGTREILIDYQNKYPEIIKLNLRIERGKGIPGKENFLSTLAMCKGKYISLCDGDDYWTDPYKLQKQQDFLEQNDDYSICWTKFLVKKDENLLNELEQPDWISHVELNKDLTFDLNNIFRTYCTYTLTAFFRMDCFDDEQYKAYKNTKDNTLYAMCLSKGNGILLNFYSGVYRIHDGGIYSKTSEFKQKYYSYLNIKEIVQKIPNCNNLNIKTTRNHLLVESIKLHPNNLSFHYLKLLIDRFKFVGIKQNLVLIIRILKVIKFGK